MQIICFLVCCLMAYQTFWLLLWPVRGQKEDTEEEKVGGTSVLNKQNIYKKNKSVSTADRSICPKLSGLTAGRK